MLMWILGKISIMPTVHQKNVFVEKDLNSWDPKILGPCNYLQSFNVAALIKECGTENHYPLLMFQNGI